MPRYRAELFNKINQTLDRPSVDVREWLGYAEDVVNDDLLRLLREKIEYHRTQLMAYEKALTAATREANPTATASTMEGQLSRHYVKGAKLEYIRGLLGKSAGTGMTASQMRAQARTDGVAVNAAFPYSMLKALEQHGEVHNAEGKYFPIISGTNGEVHALKGKDTRTTKKDTGER